MDRRKFFSLTGASALTLAAPGASNAVESKCAAPGATQSSSAKQPLKARLGHQMRWVDDPKLSYLKRFGVEGICASATIKDPNRLVANKEEMMILREAVEKHGMTLDLTDSILLRSSLIDVEKNPGIMLAKSPERDREIEAFQHLIRACAAAGVPMVKYNMSILGVVRTGETRGRGDALYSTWRLKDAPPDQPLTKAGKVSPDAFWERITYFLERVVPVANEYKVKIACHPNDPGMPPEGYRGVHTVLGTVEGLEKFLTIHESPYHGLNFCQGTVSEDLTDPGKQIFDVIRRFGQRGKIFNVHFRNIRGRRDDFMEVFPDEGSVDFVTALKTYREIGYSGLMMPDHVPKAVGGDADDVEAENFAFAFGYIRGLMQAERHVS